MAGDNHAAPTPVPAGTQRAALDAMMATLTSEALTVPAALVLPLSSPVNGRPDPQFDQEVFRNAGAAAFDPLVAADVAAQLTLDSLLAPARLTRVNEQHRRDPSLPGLDAVLHALTATTLAPRDAVGRRIAWRTVMSMATASRSEATSMEVAAALDDRLTAIARRLRIGKGADAGWGRYLAALLDDKERLAMELGKRGTVPRVPPGMPIGGDTGWFDD